MGGGGGRGVLEYVNFCYYESKFKIIFFYLNLFGAGKGAARESEFSFYKRSKSNVVFFSGGGGGGGGLGG